MFGIELSVYGKQLLSTQAICLGAVLFEKRNERRDLNGYN